jgi:hypothetical protein
VVGGMDLYKKEKVVACRLLYFLFAYTAVNSLLMKPIFAFSN